MSPKTSVKTKVNVGVLISIIIVGAFMFALAVFGFLKTEIEPTIKNDLPGWSWSFQNQDNYNYDHNKVLIENFVVVLKENQEQGEIKNMYPYSYGCYPNPAVGFLADYDNDATFQISKDNLNWYYWNQNIWQNAQNIDQANTSLEINTHIIDFYPRTLSQFYFKAVLNKRDSRLRSVAITCDQSTLKKLELYPESL